MPRLGQAMLVQFRPGSNSVRGGVRGMLLSVALALALLLLIATQALANPITNENALSGTTGWERTQADTPNIDGYTSKTSVAPGETIGFNVSTKPAVSFRIIIYRLGWYNGAGARQMTCLPLHRHRNQQHLHGRGALHPDPELRHRRGRRRLAADDLADDPGELDDGRVRGRVHPDQRLEQRLRPATRPSWSARTPRRPRPPPCSWSSPSTPTTPTTSGAAPAPTSTTRTAPIFDLDHATKVSFNRPFHRREWRFWDLPTAPVPRAGGLRRLLRQRHGRRREPAASCQQHRGVIVSGHSRVLDPERCGTGSRAPVTRDQPLLRGRQRRLLAGAIRGQHVRRERHGLPGEPGRRRTGGRW